MGEASEPQDGPVEVARRTRRRRSAHEKAPRRTRALWLALGLFGAHVIAAPMLLGGIHPWAMVTIAVSSLLSLAASAHATRAILPARAPAVLWVAIALLGWTCLQAAPLPSALVRVIAPESAEQASAAQVALGHAAPEWCALSRDPGGTNQEIVKGVAIVATLIAAFLLAASNARRDVFWIVAGSSLLMSLVALGHGILRTDKVFGLYEPLVIGRRLLLAPLMNVNNLGAFAALGAPLWLGLTHRNRMVELRWFGRLAIAITTATAVLSLSRGAAAQAFVGLVIMFWFARGSNQKRSRRPAAVREQSHSRAGIVVAIAAALGFAGYVAGEGIASEFSYGDLSKLGLVWRSLVFAADHAGIGVGRGAFSAAFVAEEGREARFVFAENFIAQWVSEWGAPLTLIWFAVVVFALYRALRKSTSLATLGAATALLALTAQNLVDLGFEILGIAVTAAALLGAVIAPDDLTVNDTKPRAQLRTVVGLQLAAGLLVLALIAPGLPGQAVPELGARLRELMRKDERAEFRSTLERAVTLHPSEPLFTVLAASEALAHQDRSVGRWLNRAMQLAPKWAAPHVLAFQWLWARGLRSQSLLELQLAAEAHDEPHSLSEHVCMLARRRGEYVLAAAPRGPNREAFLQMASACVEDHHRAAAVVDEAMMREFPNNTRGFERTANRLAKQGSVDEALRMLDDVIATRSEADSARVTRADILVRTERYDDAIKRIAEDLPRVAAIRRPGLIQIRAQALAAVGDVAGVKEAVLAYRRISGDTAAKLAHSYALEGRLEQQLGHTAAALGAFREAYRINEDTQYLIQIASLARQLADGPAQIWAMVRLCEREPKGTTYCAERDRLLRSPPFERPR